MVVRLQYPWCASEQKSMTLKIERVSRERTALIYLSGHLRSEDLHELKAELDRGGLRVVLDLREVDLVDLDGIRFLNQCESEGVGIVNCPPYIREWMSQERGLPGEQTERQE
jgi:hypothetical protein